MVSEDIRKVYSTIRHSAVPRWMSDRAYKVATDSEYIGRRFHRKNPDTQDEVPEVWRGGLGGSQVW